MVRISKTDLFQEQGLGTLEVRCVVFDMFVARQQTRSDMRIEKAHEVLALEVGLHVMNTRIIQSLDMYFLMMI